MGQETWQSLVNRKHLRKEKLERELARIVARLAEMGACRVILFGSLSRDEVGPGSDLDLIAVMPPVKSGREWMKTIYETVDRDIACDILAFTEEELDQALTWSSFVRKAVEEGKVVFTNDEAH